MTSDIQTMAKDPQVVTEAIRRLVEATCAEDTALIERLGLWPDAVRESGVGALLTHPVATACRRTVTDLVTHLATLIGPEAAQAQLDALVAEQMSTPEARALLEKFEASSGEPPPSTPSAIH